MLSGCEILMLYLVAPAAWSAWLAFVYFKGGLLRINVRHARPCSLPFPLPRLCSALSLFYMLLFWTYTPILCFLSLPIASAHSAKAAASPKLNAWASRRHGPLPRLLPPLLKPLLKLQRPLPKPSKQKLEFAMTQAQ